MMFWPFDPLIDVKTAVTNQEVRSGGEQCFNVSAYKTMDAPTDVIVELVNGERIPIMSFHSIEPKGYFKINRCFNIPTQLSANKYSVKLTAKYHINPLRDVTEVSTSDCFQIVKPTMKKNVSDNTDDIRSLETRMDKEESKGKK
jgi:hypothetical protein